MFARASVAEVSGDRQIKPESDVLRRKVRKDQVGPDEQVMSPVKAARTCLARAADRAFNLPLRVAGIRQSRLDMADVVANVEDDWAIFPLMHDDGEVGAVCINPDAVVALVSQQTTGRIPEQSGELRALTRTDIALAGPLIDEFLKRFDAALEGAPTDYWTRGYRRDDPAQNRHALALLLDASEFRAFDISINFLGTSRMGEIRFYLPIKEKPLPVPKTKPGKGQAEADLPAGAKPKSVRPVALDAHVELNAIMCRFKVPLSRLSSLSVDQVIPLPRDAMSQARLLDKSGNVSLPVNLGQLHGLRAVRLVQQEGQGEDEGNLLSSDPPALYDRPDTSGMGLRAAKEEGLPDLDLPDLDLAATDLPDLDFTEGDFPETDLPELDLPELDMTALPDLPDPLDDDVMNELNSL